MASVTSLPQDGLNAARYLADQLTPAERAEFERRLAEDPAVVEELEIAARMKTGLGTLASRGELERLIAGAGFTPQRFFAIAAAIALVAIGVALLRLEPATTTTPILAATLPALAGADGATPLRGRFAVLRTRAQGFDGTIELPAAPGAIEIRVFPDDELTSTAPATFDVTLQRGTGGEQEPIARLANARVDSTGFLVLYADSGRLSPGSYQLTLTGAGDAAQEPQTFLIRVIPPGAGTQ